MNRKNSHKSLLTPVLVLVCICVIVSGLLAIVNSITAPKIEAADQSQMQATLRELLPQASNFIEIECAMVDVLHVYKDEGGTGYAIVTFGKGYHGDITVTTAMDHEGRIIKVAVNATNETAGVGTQVTESDFTERFMGLSSADTVEVISGATYSSRGVKDAVNLALAAYDSLKGA